MSEPLPQQNPNAVSPLSEPDKNSLNDFLQNRITKLFNTPPLDLTDNDIADVVKYFRAERHRFKQLEAENEQKRQPGQRKRAVSPKSVKEALAQEPVQDLGFDEDD